MFFPIEPDRDEARSLTTMAPADFAAPTPDMEALRSTTPANVHITLRNSIDAVNDGYEALNAFAQEELYNIDFVPGFVAVNAADRFEPEDHAIFIVVRPRDMFTDNTIHIFDPNDYMARARPHNFWAYIADYLKRHTRARRIDHRYAHFVHPLMNRERKMNRGLGVCAALSIAWSRIYYIALIKHAGLSNQEALNFLSTCVASDRFDARTFLRAAFGPPVLWVAVVFEKTVRPPRMRTLYSTFRRILSGEEDVEFDELPDMEDDSEAGTLLDDSDGTLLDSDVEYDEL